MQTLHLSWIDRLFLWIRARPFFYRFTLFTRVLLVAGFIPTGLVKLMGERFTTISGGRAVCGLPRRGAGLMLRGDAATS